MMVLLVIHFPHKKYYEVMDTLTGEMARRFDQATFSLLQEMERIVMILAMELELHHHPILRRCMRMIQTWIL